MKQDFFQNISYMLDARYPVMYVETAEFERFYGHLKNTLSAKAKGYNLYQWNIVKELKRLSLTDDKASNEGDGLRDMEGVLQEIFKRKSNEFHDVYVLEGVHEFMAQPAIKVWLQRLAEELKFTQNRKHIILLSPILNLPRELEKYVSVLDMPLPTALELERILQKVVLDAKTTVSPEQREKLVQAAMGMTEMEADLAYCLAWSKTQLGERAAETVISEKEQIIRKSGILEYFSVNEQLRDVGGLNNLKDWLKKRGMAFAPAAREFHLSEPRGILLLGVPGCGKSLTAKAIASMWNMPLLRLDIGKVFEGVVGSSEQNIRSAIKTAEAVAPCILWIDEIEKGLAGTASSGSTDSGVTSRVFSTLLTWMQEKKKPVFTVATANSIESLPPELLRKGRFDAIFFVDLPNRDERIDILNIHLTKRGQQWPKENLHLLAEKSIGFNGAELEEVVNDGLFNAFAENPRTPKLQMKHLVKAIEETVILATTMEDRITFLRKWAHQRAIPAGKGNSEEIPKKNVPLAPTEVVHRKERNF